MGDGAEVLTCYANILHYSREIGLAHSDIECLDGESKSVAVCAGAVTNSVKISQFMGDAGLALVSDSRAYRLVLRERVWQRTSV